jgi:4-amino-4-deoxy-L-arabinose transferase-like glycosyltransferase
LAPSRSISPRREHERTPALAYSFFFGASAFIVFLTHLAYLKLPFYWDELGQFIPAALDLYRHGWLVPHSTVPNVHPPGLMLYLAGVWSVSGYSILATRLAMLLVASATVFVAFLLAIRLCRNVAGAPAFSAVLLLLVSPLFFMQAMLAQLDLPATLFTCLALLLFLEERHIPAALVSVALVAVKETGLVVPLVFAVWLLFEHRKRTALWYALPAVALAVWLALLWHTTGHVFGNSEFTEYNVFFALHPVRVGLALARRVYYLFLGDFHWIGWLAVLLAHRRAKIFSNRAWRVAGTLGLAHVVFVTIFGGATLERYLLPVLPLAYIAMATAWAARPSRWTQLAQAAMMIGLIVCLVWNPPYPYPYENNLAMVDFVHLQQSAATFLDSHYPGQTIVTAWPLSAALRRPDYGYVSKKLPVKRIPNFGASAAGALRPSEVSLFVLYSRDWQESWDVRRIPFVEGFLRRFYLYEPPVTAEELHRRFGLEPVARWSERGQWIEVLASGAEPAARF